MFPFFQFSATLNSCISLGLSAAAGVMLCRIFITELYEQDTLKPSLTEWRFDVFTSQIDDEEKH